MCSGWEPPAPSNPPLIAVPIPLFRGLEGLRLSFIHADAQEKFNQVNTLADLKKLKAAQQVGWADNKSPGAGGHSHLCGSLQQPVPPDE